MSSLVSVCVDAKVNIPVPVAGNSGVHPLRARETGCSLIGTTAGASRPVSKDHPRLSDPHRYDNYSCSNISRHSSDFLFFFRIQVMIVRRLISVCGILLLFSLPSVTVDELFAQEFACVVNVDISQLSGNEYDFLKDLELRIDEYINDRAWTDDRFLEHERIDCTMQITIKEAVTLTSFRANLVVATRRPIYGTMVSSTVVQFNDQEWDFNYSQGTPLVYNLERYDPLTSVIDFYVFLMLGYDYDTFSELGGTRFFERARRIAERTQASGAPGWSQVGSDQGRYQLITQLLDQRFVKLRQAYFDYHFEGLDRFVRETEVARANILTVITALEELRQEVSRSYAEDLFFSAKYQELASVFEGSDLGSTAYQVLSQVDPAHLSEYNRLTQ